MEGAALQTILVASRTADLWVELDLAVISSAKRVSSGLHRGHMSSAHKRARCAVVANIDVHISDVAVEPRSPWRTIACPV